MPTYRRTVDSVAVLPDIPAELSLGDEIELPEGFWSDSDQMTGAGFELASSSKSKAAPATPAPEPAVDPTPTPES